MREIILSLICLSLAVPAFGQASDWAELQGEFLSMVALPDNGVLILAKDHRLVKVSPDGKTETLALPALPAAAGGSVFKDFTIRGSTLTFCFFDKPLLLSIDLPKLDAWRVIEPKGLESNPEFALIEAWPDSLHLMGARGGWFAVDAAGAVKELAPNSLLVPGAEGAAFTLKAEADPKDRLKVWKVLGADGKEFLVRTSASADTYIQTFLPVGFDGDGRFVFLEGTGPGPFKRSLALYAAKDGKIVASAKLDKVGLPAFIKSRTLLADGTVAFLVQGKDRRSLVLKKFAMK